MRAFRALCCAVAITACLAPSVRGDEYTKQTFLTFSGPVQLPGLVLPEGTYMFKLADPQSGRSTLQVWDKEGTRLYTTLLTIPDQRLEPSDQPVVMFSERPSGEAQAIRAWFYPGDVIGQEFVYPKNQAMKIAQATRQPVLSFDDDESREAEQMHSARVGRIDAGGQVAENTATQSNTAQATASTSTAAAATTGNATSQQAAATSVTSDTAQSGQTALDTTQTVPPTPTTASAMPSSSTRTDRPVGTSGTSQSVPGVPQAKPGASAGAAATTQDRSANQTPNQAASTQRRELPRTASAMGLVQLIAALSLVSAFVIRTLRVRRADLR